MSKGEPATAGLVVPPPAIFAAALAGGLVLDRVLGQTSFGRAYTRTVGVLSILAGLGIGASALLSIKRVGSDPSPFAPTTALATSGPFKLSRNPAYVGATSIYIGIALCTRSLQALTFLPIALAVLDREVVAREERYLESTFGKEYRSYAKRVPRWF